MTEQEITSLICQLISFVLAIVLHETGHGFMAYKLGDPTAKSKGRLSLNPIKHIDPFGTVILPICLAAMGLPVFGYAKPVPYNPAYFKDPRKGDLLVGMAGPFMNLILAIIGGVLSWLILLFAQGVQLTGALASIIYYVYAWFLPIFVLINLYLMFFNLIPIPPLDGSSIFAVLIPKKYMHTYYRIQQYALPIFMLVLIVVPYVLSFNPIGIYLNVTAGNVAALLLPQW